MSFYNSVVAAIDALTNGQVSIRDGYVVIYECKEYDNKTYQWRTWRHISRADEWFFTKLKRDEEFYTDKSKCDFYWSPQLLSVTQSWLFDNPEIYSAAGGITQVVSDNAHTLHIKGM